MKKEHLFYIAITLLLASCSERTNVRVFVDSRFIKANKVILDDTLTLKNDSCPTAFCDFSLPSGEHTLSINGKKEQVEIGKNGGILNVEHAEFVIFPIKYTSNDNITKSMVETDFPLLIENFVVYEKSLAPSQTSLISLMKNDMAKDLFNYKINKTDKNLSFIDKSWDYDMNDPIADSITIETTATAGNIEYKKTIIKAAPFLIYASKSGIFHVEPVENKELVDLINNFEKE